MEKILKELKERKIFGNNFKLSKNKIYFTSYIYTSIQNNELLKLGDKYGFDFDFMHTEENIVITINKF